MQNNGSDVVAGDGERKGSIKLQEGTLVNINGLEQSVTSISPQIQTVYKDFKEDASVIKQQCKNRH